MQQDDITIVICDAELTSRYVIEDWQSLDATVTRNAPGPGSVRCAVTRELMAALEPGAHVVLYLGDSPVAWHAGPIERLGPHERSISDDTAGRGLITISWVTHEVWLGRRLAYPDPTAPATQQTNEARWERTGPAEGLIKELIGTNLGPGALPVRRVPRLQIEPLHSPPLGATVSIGTRFQAVSDVARDIAVAGGELTWYIEHLGRDLVFRVRAPRDLSGKVRFSIDSGNLISYRAEPQAPTCTTAIVAGQGEGTERTIIERAVAASPWGRIESFVDRRDTDDTAELQAAGDAALAEGAERTDLAAEAIDLPDPRLPRYGRDYHIGDLVTVELDEGVELADMVTGARLQAPGDGTYDLSVIIGARDAVSDDVTVAVRNLRQRIAKLEVSQ